MDPPSPSKSALGGYKRCHEPLRADGEGGSGFSMQGENAFLRLDRGGSWRWRGHHRLTGRGHSSICGTWLYGTIQKYTYNTPVLSAGSTKYFTLRVPQLWPQNTRICGVWGGGGMDSSAVRLRCPGAVHSGSLDHAVPAARSVESIYQTCGRGAPLPGTAPLSRNRDAWRNAVLLLVTMTATAADSCVWDKSPSGASFDLSALKQTFTVTGGDVIARKLSSRTTASAQLARSRRQCPWECCPGHVLRRDLWGHGDRAPVRLESRVLQGCGPIGDAGVVAGRPERPKQGRENLLLYPRPGAQGH